VAQPAEPVPLIAVRDVAKRFGQVEALRGVSFSLAEAQVLGLLGDNGAGKSTLIKLLAGLFPPDRGEIRWRGRRVYFKSPRDAYQLGIATVYQDLAVVEVMSVYRNMFLGHEGAVTRGWGPLKWLDRSLARHETMEALRSLGITIHSADEPVARLSGGERQSIAVARGVHFSAKLLILDEPTASLSVKQSAQVLRAVEKAREKGLSVIFITHNVHHVHPVADRYLILSRGESVAEFERGEHSREEIAEMIAQGRELIRQLDTDTS